MRTAAAGVYARLLQPVASRSGSRLRRQIDQSVIIAAGASHGGSSTWALHPDVIAVVAGVALFYWWSLTRLRLRLDAPAPSRRQKGYIVSAVALLWVVSDGPVHDLSEGVSYTLHMAQHLALTFVVPPMLLLGTPEWLVRWIVRPVMPALRLVTRPVVALALFNAVAALTHWPAIVKLSVESGPAHFAQHSLLVLSALAMFWPVIGPLPELPRLPPLFAMVYLFLQSLLPTVPASWLAFAEHPPYHVYEAFPKLWGLTATTDQQLAGAVMKLGGGIILWTGIAVIFFRWVARDGGAGRPAHALPDPAQAPTPTG